ncbi:hypothetical protein O6H91_11G069400 [Diphasiastrum complanatum]|uniref:Uncharacterized protein n=1 Tax=Diphasiastrum complanatum TaxID=34168 RepID=A0ACC2CAA4_DIPCM|nr:hypothetical protein O6H91_11G069400 [Diphasiastrum complanatum]
MVFLFSPSRLFSSHRHPSPLFPLASPRPPPPAAFAAITNSITACSSSSSRSLIPDNRARFLLIPDGLCRSYRQCSQRRAARFRNTSEASDGLKDDGVIEDMEKYLNDLSLEYESVWDTKPAWCQPWTIILTGLVIVSGSWLLFHLVVVTAVLAFLVAAWWFIFLYSYPLAYSEMIDRRRKALMEGNHDHSGRT